MSKPTIKVNKNGNYLVTGEVDLVDDQGNPIPHPVNQPFNLCRCGQSQTKPFCDGSHKTCGFIG